MIKWTFAIASAALLQILSPAQSQDFPSRPITIVVPFPAGGAFDTIGRIIADRMKMSLGQPVIIENAAGASGSLGVARVARATPDGYTLCLGYWGTHVINAAIYALQYDPLNDFAPISLLVTNPLVIVARKDLPADDLKELVAWLRADRDKASLATVGIGSPPHVAGLLLQQLTGTRFHYVPYRGGAPATQALVAGQVDLSILQAGIVVPQIRAGTIKAYAVTARQRLQAVASIPAADEAGVPGLHVSIWSGLWAPKATPTNVVARINTAVVDALADETVRRRLADIGQEIFPREQQSPKALAAFHIGEAERWLPIVKAAGIRAE
jgi:tripartite-type tricarboxylate transporter receptor subunit TctC